MADDSIQIIKRTLPKEWVIREYTPDYGIDLKIEIFEVVNDIEFEALGEFILAQVKSVGNTVTHKIKVKNRGNVAQFPLTYTSGEEQEIEVLKFALDTDTIVTIQSMGAAVPVFLLYVTLDTNKIYYICLTDYIDKILIPEDPDFRNKKTKTLNIPISNEITPDPIKTFPLRFGAVRMKFYALFVKSNYQRTVINCNYDGIIDLEIEVAVEKLTIFLYQVLYFMDEIKSNDIWRYIDNWGGLKICYDTLNSLNVKITTHLDVLLSESPDKYKILEYNPPLITNEIKVFWDNLVNLGNLYEEIIREKNLPSKFSYIMQQYEI